jgi:hypothetical protein
MAIPVKLGIAMEEQKIARASLPRAISGEKPIK